MKSIRIFLAVLTIIGIGVLLTQTPHKTQVSGQQTYTNTKYRFQVQYPKEYRVSYIYGESVPIPDELLDAPLIMKIPPRDTPSEFPIFGVTAYIPHDPDYGWNDSIALPLRDFAEAVRKRQIDGNPNEPGKKSGELTAIRFANHPAYSFTQDFGFNGAEGSYAFFPSSSVFNFIAVENNAGQKLLIHYRVGDPVAEKIKDSFSFVAP
jgi:hypothetical protein